MSPSRTLFIGMDVHKETIAVASVAQDHGAEVTYLGSIGTRQCAIDHLIRTMPAKATHLSFVYEERMQFLGLMPAESSSGARRRQGAMTTAGKSHARRALGEGAWAYRYPAQGSRHLPLRREQQPKAIPDSSWKAQGRLWKRYRTLLARGQHAHPVVVARARELMGCMWAMAKESPVTP